MQPWFTSSPLIANIREMLSSGRFLHPDQKFCQNSLTHSEHRSLIHTVTILIFVPRYTAWSFLTWNHGLNHDISWFGTTIYRGLNHDINRGALSTIHNFKIMVQTTMISWSEPRYIVAQTTINIGLSHDLCPSDSASTAYLTQMTAGKSSTSWFRPRYIVVWATIYRGLD